MRFRHRIAKQSHWTSKILYIPMDGNVRLRCINEKFYEIHVGNRIHYILREIRY